MNFTTLTYQAFLCCVLFLTGISGFLFAQDPLQPGYIIPLEGDAITGFVDLRGQASNAQMIRFRTALDSKEQVFYPEDIREYGADSGYFFESFLVSFNASPYRTDLLTDHPDPEIQQKYLFLQRYVAGELSMFVCKDEQDKLHIYLQKGQNSPEVLINYRYLQKVREGSRVVTRIREKKKYLNQLANIMSDCEEIRKEFLFQKYARLAWNEEAIQALVIRYNQLQGEKNLWFLDDVKEKSKPLIQAGFMAGPAFSKVRFVMGPNTRTALQSANFPVTTSLSAGLFVHLQSRRNQGRWGVQLELLRHRIRTESETFVEKSSAEHYNYHIELDLSYLRTGVAVRYNWPTFSDFKPFGLFGLSPGFLLNDYNKLSTSRHFYGSNEYTVEAVFQDEPLLKYELGTMTGLGLVKKPYMVELRYNYAYRGFSPIIGVGTPNHSLYILMGIFF